jgi:protein-tyrosine phosphatase
LIDIHCHILPGIDHDGPVTHQQSLDMARIAVGDGIHTVIATPHLTQHGLSSQEIRELADVMNFEFRSSGIPLTILPGAEVVATLEPETLSTFTLNGGGYILLEFSRGMSSESLVESVYELCLAGFRPIIAHAERIPRIQRSPSLVAELIASGAFVQITAESLTGNMGAEARTCARFLLRQRHVHFLATDAHSDVRRRPILSEGLMVASSIIGDVSAECLVLQNPAAVIQGKGLNA